MLHGSRVCSFHVSTVIRTANSFNKSAAKVQTVKCYNIVHKALMISSFIVWHLHSHPAGDFTTASSFSLTSSSLQELIFWTFSFLSNNALLTLMVPYASDSARWQRGFLPPRGVTFVVWVIWQARSRLNYRWSCTFLCSVTVIFHHFLR